MYQVDKVSRNRCTFCRWQKCLNSGMNQASVQEILITPYFHHIIAIIFLANHHQEGEKRQQQATGIIAQSHSPLSSSSANNQEQDYIDTISGEVFEAEIYSSQMLEREDVGHLYYIFTWAQRLLKVASFQAMITITITTITITIIIIVTITILAYLLNCLPP